MKLLLGISIILLMVAGALYLIKEVWRHMSMNYRQTYARLRAEQMMTPEQRAEREARAKAVKLAEAKALLLRYKQSRRTAAFYEDEAFNPATGLPMLTATQDIGGNDSSVIGGI